MQLIFATHNENKVNEIQVLLPPEIKIISLKEINITSEIPETGDTLEENALLKARFISNTLHKDCFADDTGLEIKALDNRPGVYSARYAGEEKKTEANMDKVLEEMKSITDRTARFRTVIALILNKKEYLFEGIINGAIALEKKGKKGFGYDPLFVPNGHNKTFAEMNMEEKNRISHRAIAIQKLVNFLKDK